MRVREGHVWGIGLLILLLVAIFGFLHSAALDAEGLVAAHSREPQTVGRALESPVDRRAVQASEPLMQDAVEAEGDGLYDFSVPVIVDDRRWGTARVGLSQERMRSEIRQTRLELGVLTAIAIILGGVAAALVASRIALRMMSGAVSAVFKRADHLVIGSKSAGWLSSVRTPRPSSRIGVSDVRQRSGRQEPWASATPGTI